MIARAARLANRTTRERFEALLARFKFAADTDDNAVFVAADRELDALSLVAANNYYAEMAMGSVQAQTRRFW